MSLLQDSVQCVLSRAQLLHASLKRCYEASGPSYLRMWRSTKRDQSNTEVVQLQMYGDSSPFLWAAFRHRSLVHKGSACKHCKMVTQPGESLWQSINGKLQSYNYLPVYTAFSKTEFRQGSKKAPIELEGNCPAETRKSPSSICLRCRKTWKNSPRYILYLEIWWSFEQIHVSFS